MSEELRPCPFCKSNNTTLDYYEISGPQELGTIVVCNDCGASAKSIVDWNTRPIEDALTARIAKLEAAQRWIPVSESPKECEMRVFKDGNAWCFVLPDFQDLQVSSSVWMKEGVLDKIYKELRSVKNERQSASID